ncbi:hypothetical protein RISK_004848 [Rhodopirellula islandica]|uniref:Uncharacterized protein n=1 Tax=Rhodopirellula islandica TaxID=595434 RepID=A0A0J1B8M3_RHOIS|nr:hypothetical protein RISK_004848 [Rhodopirellula islandica]
MDGTLWTLWTDCRVGGWHQTERGWVATCVLSNPVQVV